MEELNPFAATGTHGASWLGATLTAYLERAELELLDQYF